MYEIFAKLLDERGITPYQVYKATGVAQSSLSDWKNGKSRPKYDKMKKIADFFGVSIEYLTTGERHEQKKEPLKMDNVNENFIILSRAAKNMTPEQLKQLVDVAKVMFAEEFMEE